MFTLNVDLGQIIISSLIGAIGWFSIRTVNRIETRLDEHEKNIDRIGNQIQYIIGRFSIIGLEAKDKS